MTAALLLSVARVVVAVSALAALLAHAWLTVGYAWIPTMSLAALAVGALGGWAWRRGTQGAILALGHVWPLVSFLSLGTTDPQVIMIWVSALAALAMSTSPLTRWSLPSRWQIPIAAWGVLIALGWPIVLVRELDFSLATYYENGATLGLAAGPIRYTLAIIIGSSATVLSSILVFDWLWARYGPLTDERFVREVAGPLTIGTIVALLVGIYQGIVDLGWWNFGQWRVLGRATGTFFDANALGAVAALWAAPMAGAAMLAERRVPRVAGLALLSLAAVAVWACGSRTALLGLLTVFAAVAIALARAGRLSRLTSALAVLVIVVTIGVGWMAGGPSNALHRAWTTLPSPSAEDITRFASAMWSRDGYGAASVEMLRDHPLTGVGPGAFSIFAPDYRFKLSGALIPADNAQNWWRHQISEVGLVAGLIPIVCSVLVLGATFGALRRGRPAPATVAAGAMIGTGLMSAVGSPASHPIVLLTITLLIFWTASFSAHPGIAAGAGDTAATPRGRGRRRWLLALCIVWLLPIAWAGATAWTAVRVLRPPYRAEAVGWVYTYGFSAPEDLGGGAQRRWAAHRAVGVVPGIGARMVLTFKSPPDAIGDGPLHLRVFTRDRVLLDQTLSGNETATATIDLTGRKWTMVQIETSRRGAIVDGVERAVEITTRVE